MKSTMNSRDIAKFHKLLAAEVSSNEIVKILGIEVETLKKFTPEKVKAAKIKRKDRQAQVLAERKKTQEIAAAAVQAARSAVDG